MAGRAVDAGEDQAAPDLAPLAGERIDRQRDLAVQRADRLLVESHREVIVHFAQPVLVLEPQPVVQGQPRARPPVVLDEHAVVPREGIDRRRHGNRAARHVAQQQIRHGVAGGGGRRKRIRPLRERAVEREVTGRLPVGQRIHADMR